VVESPLFAPGSVLKLGKATVIESDGSIGKTSLYEWIAAAAGNRIVDRWSGNRVRLNIRYASPLPHRLEYTSDHGRHQYLLDNAVIHLPPSDLQIVHLPEDALRHSRPLDDLETIADVFSIDKSVTFSLATEIARNGSGFLSALRFVEEQSENNGEPQRDERATILSLT
jgi:hypothetical protein